MRRASQLGGNRIGLKGFVGLELLLSENCRNVDPTT